MSNPLVSIIVLTCNGKKFLGPCFDSILAQTYVPIEIIFVDNGSTDGSAQYIRERYKDKVTVIENPCNYGYARGNNIGMHRAQGKYVFVLNDDTQLDHQCVASLVSAAEQDGKIGMLAPKIVLLSQMEVIDCIGIDMCKDGMSFGRAYHERDGEKFSTPQSILMPSGTAALYRKQMLEDIGYFDEDFFIYCEDTDLGLRARIAGWSATYVPQALVRHHYSGTTGSHSPMKAYLVERNHFWVVCKNFPVFLFPQVLVYSIYRYVLIVLSMFIRKGKASVFTQDSSAFRLALILFKAWIDSLLALPRMLKKRKDMHGIKRIPNKEIATLIHCHSVKLAHFVFQD